MHRSFETSTTRRRRALDGHWDFLVDPDDEGINAAYYKSFPDDADQIDVPAAWNASTKYDDHESPVWYRRQFAMPDPGLTRIVFQGVCHDATVWLDGERIAEHYGGYTPFEEITDIDAGEHELVVRADNSRDERSIPRPGTDWYPYGGITREVIIESVPNVFVNDLEINYSLDEDHADVTVTVTVRNEGDATEERVAVEIGDTFTERVVSLDGAMTSVDFHLSLTVTRWSPNEPTLYKVAAKAGEGDHLDEYCERIGFRTVEVTDTDLVVNGNPIDLRGVNRHEDHPEWGHAQPLRLQELDLDVIEAAGLNTVRTSHYPNHPRFLDCCDERGILVIEEIPYWQFNAERFGRDGVLDRGKTMLTEMIDRDRSHPSVLAWSVTNECANDEAGVAEATGELVDIVRDLDDRPVTLASNNYHPNGDGDDLCLKHVDFVCANGYPGWYREGKYANVLAGVREDYPEKPIVVSEFGAGAVYGERTRDDQKWSEGFQAAFIEDAIETFDDTEYVAGYTIWQYCDTRTDPRKWEGRPKTKNNKGIVDEYRRPKEAYHRVSELTDE